MSKVSEQSLFMGDVAKLIQFIQSKGHNCTFGETWRTPEQAELYAKAGMGIKNSLHIDRLAIDINIFDKSDILLTTYAYEEFGIYWESLSPKNRWGGYFVRKYGGHIVDGDHFERKI